MVLGQHNELAYQRSQIIDEIKEALVSAAVGPVDFSGYQRAVRYKWSLDPLSTEGSIKDIGGRFNIGDIDKTKFPAFPALYLSKDKNTAVQEIFQCDPDGVNGLNAQELALTTPDSILIVSVFGSLETVIDLEQPKRLQGFVDLIKDFEYPDSIKKEAVELGVKDSIVENIEQLLHAIYEPDWRRTPMVMDVPSSSQIFGQLVMSAGVEGIQYKSKYTVEPCLAVYTQNFLSPDSFIEIKDQCPPGVIRKRIDVKNPILIKD